MCIAVCKSVIESLVASAIVEIALNTDNIANTYKFILVLNSKNQ